MQVENGMKEEVQKKEKNKFDGKEDDYYPVTIRKTYEMPSNPEEVTSRDRMIYFLNDYKLKVGYSSDCKGLPTFIVFTRDSEG